jgi:hypothetical protein
MTKQRRQMVLGWISAALLIVAVIGNFLAEDNLLLHKVLLAVSCYCLGITCMSLFASPVLNRQREVMEQQQAVLEAMTREFERAINDGRIEVVPMIREDDRPKTLH